MLYHALFAKPDVVPPANGASSLRLKAFLSKTTTHDESQNISYHLVLDQSECPHRSTFRYISNVILDLERRGTCAHCTGVHPAAMGTRARRRHPVIHRLSKEEGRISTALIFWAWYTSFVGMSRKPLARRSV
jgi:hypothetical protein